MHEDSNQGDRLVGADRVLAVLLALGEEPAAATLDGPAPAVDRPKPTVHRALAALCRAGLAEQVGRGTYQIADEFIRLPLLNAARRPDAQRVLPALDELARAFNETTHYAVLDGPSVVYRAKGDPEAGAVRLTSTIGGRNPAQRTAVGKAILASPLLTRDAVAEWEATAALEAGTPNSIRSIDTLHEELVRTRERGYAIDDHESEIGVNCIAFPVFLDGSSFPTGAVSVGALAYRKPLKPLGDRVPELIRIACETMGETSVDGGQE